MGLLERLENIDYGYIKYLSISKSDEEYLESVMSLIYSNMDGVTVDSYNKMPTLVLGCTLDWSSISSNIIKVSHGIQNYNLNSSTGDRIKISSDSASESEFTFDNSEITAFHGINESEVIIPPTIGGVSVTKIGDYSFGIGGYSVSTGFSATSITFPSSITQIGEGAFIGSVGNSNCPITTIIMKSTSPLENYVFLSEVSSLSTIYVPTSALSLYKSKWAQYSDKISGA